MWTECVDTGTQGHSVVCRVSAQLTTLPVAILASGRQCAGMVDGQSKYYIIKKYLKYAVYVDKTVKEISTGS